MVLANPMHNTKFHILCDTVMSYKSNALGSMGACTTTHRNTHKQAHIKTRAYNPHTHSHTHARAHPHLTQHLHRCAGCQECKSRHNFAQRRHTVLVTPSVAALLHFLAQQRLRAHHSGGLRHLLRARVCTCVYLCVCVCVCVCTCVYLCVCVC